MTRIAPLLLGLALAFRRAPQSITQDIAPPDTVAVTSGSLTLHGLLWRPAGSGPFPAVLFNHGSYGVEDSMPLDKPSTLGPLFARHGYVFLLLFRQGIGLSQGQGTADADLMAQAWAAHGPEGRNRMQLHLLETDELDEALAGLTFLRSLPEVDSHRLATVGHSFGGSLTVLLAARDTTVRVAVAFAPAAFSWERSPELRSRLRAAVDRTHAPVLFIHAANDFSVVPGKALAAEMQRRGKPHELKIYPAIGSTPGEGHNLVYLSLPTWEPDVFRFLNDHLRGD